MIGLVVLGKFVSQIFFSVRGPNMEKKLPAGSVSAFYRAMLCIRGTSHGPVSVRPSVCPSQAGVLLKRQNVGSHKQHHTIPQGL